MAPGRVVGLSFILSAVPSIVVGVDLSGYEGHSETVVSDPLVLGSAGSVLLVRTSGRDELSSDRSRSLIRAEKEIGEAEELWAWFWSSVSPRLEIRCSANKLRLELLPPGLKG